MHFEPPSHGFVPEMRHQMPYKVSAINPAKTALIIVDMENDFVAEGAPLRAKMAPAVVPPLQRALAHARQTGMRRGARCPAADDPFQRRLRV